MSYQLLEEMPGWEEDTDRLLHMLPIVGCVVRKSYLRPDHRGNRSELIPPDKFVVNYWTKRPGDVPPGDARSGVLPARDRGEVPGRCLAQGRARRSRPTPTATTDAPHVFLEQHRLWDLDDDDYPEPYIVTVHKETREGRPHRGPLR
jgi:chaperonin GroES